MRSIQWATIVIVSFLVLTNVNAETTFKNNLNNSNIYDKNIHCVHGGLLYSLGYNILDNDVRHECYYDNGYTDNGIPGARWRSAEAAEVALKLRLSEQRREQWVKEQSAINNVKK